MLDTKKMKAIRERLGISQEEAARLAGFKGGRQRWSNIESGRAGGSNVKMDTLDAIAEALGVKPKDLLK